MKKALALDLIADATARAVKASQRIFQAHRFAGTEAAHCSRLLRWAEISQNATVLDVGCGVGAMAAYWMAERPDLTVMGLNLSMAQLAYATNPVCCGDMGSLPFADGSFDVVSYCFCIGHSDTFQALREAYRVFRLGGVVFLYDMVRIAGDNIAMHEVAYSVGPRSQMEHWLQGAGFRPDWYLEPFDDGQYGRFMLGDGFGLVFGGTIPALWRWRKP